MTPALRILSVACALAGPAAGAAEVPLPTRGLGISTGLASTSERLAVQGLDLTLALRHGRLRIEPLLGFGWRHVQAPDGIAPGDATWITRSYTAGLGVLWEVGRSGNAVAWAGGRATLDVADESAYRDEWATGETVGAVLGGEYFVAPLISFGLEAEAGFSAQQRADVPDVVLGSTKGRLLVRLWLP